MVVTRQAGWQPEPASDQVSVASTIEGALDAARALGKNAFSYKLQSLAISAGLGAVAGWFLVLNLQSVDQTQFEPIFTFFGYVVLILGGLASSTLLNLLVLPVLALHFGRFGSANETGPPAMHGGPDREATNATA